LFISSTKDREKAKVSFGAEGRCWMSEISVTSGSSQKTHRVVGKIEV